MNIFKIGAVSALVIVAMGVTAGTSYAAPVTPDVGFESQLVDGNVVTTLTNGTFDLSPDRLVVEVKNTAGSVLESLGLNYTLDGLQFPLLPALSNDDTTLTLTPERDPAKAVVAPLLNPVASNAENAAAMGDFSAKLGIAMSIGGLVGMGLGLVAGCIIGLPALPTIVGFLTACGAGAGVGSIVGTLVAGGPTLVAAGIDLISTLNAAPGTTRWANP